MEALLQHQEHGHGWQVSFNKYFKIGNTCFFFKGALISDENGLRTAHCGATLISDTHAITAAHCLFDSGTYKNPSSLILRLGEHNIEREVPEDASRDYQIAAVIGHSDFIPRTYLNDIALLKLAERVRHQL